MIEILHEQSYPFNTCYNRWRETRVNKLISLFGNDWSGKKVLELACAHGNIGLYLKTLGADITFADAREQHLAKVLEKDSTAKTILVDQDTAWDINQEFDIILHFGVLYHLDNWKQDLKSALKHTQTLILESAVADADYEYEYKLHEDDEGGQNAFNKVGTLPSATSIENYITSLGYTFTRFDDDSLNTNWFKYDWQVSNPDLSSINVSSYEDKPLFGGRRFWLISLSPSVS